MDNIVKKNILGVHISNVTKREVLEYIWDLLKNSRESIYIVTPNPEIVMASIKDDSLKDVLNNAQISLCDGIGLFLASKILGKAVKERITGVEMLDLICKESVRKPVNIGFLGGKGSVALKTAECLKEKYSGLNISFVSDEWSLDGFKQSVCNPTKESKNEIDILFVAFGFPKQEKWMAENFKKEKFKVSLGVGGAFDYYSGNVKRAPKFFRTLGLEWLFRLLLQPWRFKRQLSLISFIFAVLKERVNPRHIY